jgi:DNA-binding response OmpR family regulator
MSLGRATLVIDNTLQTVEVRGQLISLTPVQRRLLRALASTPGQVRSRVELTACLRGGPRGGQGRTVDSHIKNLRRRVEIDPTAPQILLTAPGRGYVLGLNRDICVAASHSIRMRTMAGRRA